MGNLLARVGSAWGAAKSAWELGSRPPSGQVVVPDARLDSVLSAVSDNLNFSSLRSMLRAAVSGDLGRGLQLFDEMKQKDATLHSVAGTRQKALTGLDWEIVSAADVEAVAERSRADEAAVFVRDRLARLATFDEAIEHLANAVGTNLAVVELVWEGLELIDLVGVHGWRLRMEPSEPGVIRVITSGNAVGVVATGPKWVVHIPDSASGFPLSRSIFHAQAFVYLIKMLALADWVVFCEIFGMPIRIAKYQPSATPDEKTELIDMMKNLGTKAFGVFSQAVTLEFVESSQRGTAPFKDLIEWCDRTQAKVFLGGHLTTDTTGGTGTLAAASVQDSVRDDLRDDDMKREARTIRRQLIAPMCAFRFRRDVPLPYFRRIKPEVVDRVQEANLFAAGQRLGLKIGEDYAYERLGIQKPKGGEAVLDPPDAFEAGVTEGFDGEEAA